MSSEPAAAGALEGVDGLPAPVRDLLAEWAADALRALPAAEVPARLKRVASFAPTRLASRARTQLERELVGDPVFRQQVAERVKTQRAEVAAALKPGEAVGDGDEPGSAVDPAEWAAALWLARPDGWAAGVADAVARQAAERDSRALAAGERADASRWQRLEAQVESARTEAAQARGELAEAHRELARTHRELREARAAVGRADAEARQARDEAQALRTEAEAERDEALAEARRQAAQRAAAEEAADAARSRVREGRALADARARLLLDAVVDGALALRRELGLPPVAVRPGEVVAATADMPGAPTGPGAQALPADDPGRLDQLVQLPGAHLVVDGYNVTKTGYGGLTLEDQRDRLVAGLAAVASRTGAEVTCVFDGAEAVGGVPGMATRGVRVLFSRAGEIADTLIARLVAAEPRGRVVVVVSSDREVADAVARLGARPIESAALLRLLGRG